MPSLRAGSLIAERAGMRAPRRAMDIALKQRDVSASPILSQAFPGASDLLVAVNMLYATLPVDSGFREIRDGVVEYLRIHPDVEAIRTQVLGVSDAFIDQLFRDAMAANVD